jgi:hypothetical protein
VQWGLVPGANGNSRVRRDHVAGAGAGASLFDDPADMDMDMDMDMSSRIPAGYAAMAGPLAVSRYTDCAT